MKVIKSENLVCIVTLISRADKVDELLYVLHTLIQHSAKESDILRYELHQDEKNARKFILVERYANTQAFVSHCEQPHVKRIFDTGEINVLCESIDISTSQAIQLDAK